jgi:ribonuclease PH
MLTRGAAARGGTRVAKKNAARIDGRRPDELRPVKIRRRYTSTPHGSVLIQTGATRVLCTAMVEEGVPVFLRNSGRGWVTAEYGMLPGSTRSRKPRDSISRIDSRGVEIRRLIGRVMRAAVDLRAIADHTIWLDCDVLEADGGTRTAAITGAYVALADALAWMKREKTIKVLPLRCMIAAVSVGIVDGQPILDLCYREDARAEVDMNVVMTDGGKFIEVQGTAEGGAFGERELGRMLKLAKAGTREVVELQAKALRWRRRPWE